LLGWSNGGTTVLYAVRAGGRGGSADFAKAVAFYPGCRTLAESGRWSTRMPLLILIGAEDDWTAPEPCVALASAAKARGEPVSITVYPGAFHGFDHPNQPLRLRTGLAFTAKGDGEARTGTDPAARADALSRVPAFLAR
jgi:dienelactone hydrolase